ncbi:hypothetical protein OB13_19590 [Pontibacter sp. HJ8]
MQKNTRSRFLLLLVLIPLSLSCQQKTEEDKTLASTHPRLEKQLEKDTVRAPDSLDENPDVYQHYRLRMDAYQTDEAYRVDERYKGILAPLEENSHPDVAKLRSALQSGLKQGVNFAGQYTVVTVDCGTTCQDHYVVDRTNGKILDKVQSSIGARYTPDSRIFIVNPPDSSLNYIDCPYCEPAAYVFENDKFRKLPQGQ